ncbi:MAG: hypothetical protein E6H10_02450 [Bacteroidetes bacterium]|nr:MAG: hypothetical protein E6H10_02450 [Bacteroidota bacterium]
MKTIKWFFALAAPLLIVSCKKESSLSQKSNALAESTTATGNGAPSGPHYNLNIIGVDNPKNFDFNTVDQQNTQGQGHRIFVPLDGTSKILLREGDFSVLDANGTDGIAAFQLPKPDSNNDGITSYSVFIRGLGKPGGSATMSSCITDGTDTYCSIDQGVSVSLSAHGNNNKFTNVSKQLLFVYADTSGTGQVARIPLFSDPLFTYYWNYQNTGLRLAQLRFYDISTNVN